MNTENQTWITIKDTPFGSCHEKHDATAIITSSFDANRGGLIWAVHFKGNLTHAEQTFTKPPKSLRETCNDLIQICKQIAVSEGKYELGAAIRELEKKIEPVNA